MSLKPSYRLFVVEHCKTSEYQYIVGTPDTIVKGIMENESEDISFYCENPIVCS